ncbi:PREDICTED: interleukin-34, partial [Nanorana parkeri]|uniref:interleukin-34 n=1 Tax=Nanorana parkeri TaxID=125878 RepID=UPI000854C183
GLCRVPVLRAVTGDVRVLQISKGITVKELRYLWGIVNESILQTIQRALLERHPTRPFIAELQGIFNVLLRGTAEESEEVVKIVDRLHNSEDKVKAVTPKSLLDNCNRVLYALYGEDCRLGNSRSEDTLCPPGSLPEPSSQE